MTLHTEILPAPQLELWNALAESPVPPDFVLYGGTAIALRIGHRTSIDFDFFARIAFEPEQLLKSLKWASNAETVQSAPDTLTIRTRGGVLVSFFGGLEIRQVSRPDIIPAFSVRIASMDDLLATKLKTVCDRAEVKDYIDIDALLEAGQNLAYGLAAARAVYGHSFNPTIPLKALTYYEDGDVDQLPADARTRLLKAVSEVEQIPELEDHASPLGALS